MFRIVCQISGQDNASYEIQKSCWHFFRIIKFCLEQKATLEIFVLTRVLFVTAVLTIALRCSVEIQQTP